MRKADRCDAAWAFVKGASLHAGAVGYWAGQNEVQPNGLNEFIAERIEDYCWDFSQHGFDGRAWADRDPLGVTLADTIREATRRYRLRAPAWCIEAACARYGVRPDARLHEVAELATEVIADALAGGGR
jgi:hypothetical protein